VSWTDRWKAISARIEGLVKAGELTISAFTVKNRDRFAIVRNALLPEVDALKREIDTFHEEYGRALPPAAAAALKRFIDHNWSGTNNHPDLDVQLVVPFALFRSEFQFLLRDTELDAKSTTELAFEHLKRLLSVDSDVRRKWAEAFDRREEHCERLGATHLLSHGIWAFKVSATGAATDLVFGDPVANELGIVRRTARALVLTEWKLVKDATELESQAEVARRQTEIYAVGILGDLELKSTRYIALVTRKNFQPPADRMMGSITFRHVVLAIDPDSPSKESR